MVKPGVDPEKGAADSRKDGRKHNKAIKFLWAWASLCRPFLEPLGLWITQRILNASVALPNGFPRIAEFLASDPDHLVTVYKKFDTLSYRNLLLLEARVAALGLYQRRLDIEDVTRQNDSMGKNFVMMTAPASFECFACAAASELHDFEKNVIDIPKYVLEDWTKANERDEDILQRGLRKKREKPVEEGKKPVKAGKIPSEEVETPSEEGTKSRNDYFLKRWEVAKALQKALKEYRKDLSYILVIIASAPYISR